MNEPIPQAKDYEPSCDTCRHWLLDKSPVMLRPFRTGWCSNHKLRTDAIYECEKFEPLTKKQHD